MIYIVIRQTTDWDDEAVFRAQIPEAFRPAVELWDSTFDMPYRVFRRELTRIARLSLSRIEGASCVPLGDVPAGALVVPTDDDDWFSPRLAAALSAASLELYAGCYWPSAFIEVPISLGHSLGLLRKAVFPGTRPKWLCTTNNYAVVMTKAAPPLVASHIKASRWFVAHPGEVTRLDEYLSVMNRTLASQTSFRSVASRGALLRKFRRYERVYRKAPGPELAWCDPYVGMMRELMSALRMR